MDNLVKKRGVLKSNLTRMKKFMDKFVPESDLGMLRERMVKFEPLYDNFDQVQSEIEELTPVANLDACSEERDDFEESYFALLAAAHDALGAAQPGVTPNHSATTSSSQAKLPAIPLPTFDGRVELFLSFRESFLALVDANANYSDLEKHHYLRSCLKGRASSVIESLELTAANYTIAWKLVCDRFENKRVIVAQHIRSLFELTCDHKSAYGLQRFLDATNRHLRALESLDPKGVENSFLADSLLIHLLSSKLDQIVRSDWEKSLHTGEIPTFKQFSVFLEQQCYVQGAISQNSITDRGSSAKSAKPTTKTSSFLVKENKCACCGSSHVLNNCAKFTGTTPKARFEIVKSAGLCLKCFSSAHRASKCQSGGCSSCGGNHHLKLCFASAKAPEKPPEQPEGNTTINLSSRVIEQANSYTFLSTASVVIVDSRGREIIARALLDSGSQSNYISEHLCRRLGLRKIGINMTVAGLQEKELIVKHRVNASFKSMNTSEAYDLSALVVPCIAGRSPPVDIDTSSLVVPGNIALADPVYNIAAPIDMLIGNGLFWQIICPLRVKSNISSLSFQETTLGWLVVGSWTFGQQSFRRNVTTCHLSIDQLGRQLDKFWEIEEVADSPPPMSVLDRKCEEIYRETTNRDSSGRYVVSLPLKENISSLGDSHSNALSRFKNLERKLQRDPELKSKYMEFMNDYSSLGHMTRIDRDSHKDSYYIPHHGVFHNGKIRVVFDASCKTSSRRSLNDILLAGPKLQTEVTDILMRFRSHRFVLTADLVKMFRQIIVIGEHRPLQRILWRSSPDDNIGTYELNTVTYGTVSAPYLAIRTIHQLCADESDNYPLASQVARRDMYVDDVITGHDDENILIEIRDQLIKMFASAGFEIHKWNSNHLKLLEPHAVKEFSTTAKTLGVCWDSNTDSFAYKFAINVEQVTKRSVLSCIAQIFDPIGLIGPVVVVGKRLMQAICGTGKSWDEPLSPDFAREWLRFLNDLTDLSKLQIPRLVRDPSAFEFELHGFCDASEVAYAACIYIRSISSSGHSTALLCAKTRIAPLKKTTLPRLELCAAELLAKLVGSVRRALTIEFSKQYLWSDSSVALSWITSESGIWHTFVANRVSRIQSLTDVREWHHVASINNPADIASRGSTVDQLSSHTQWWIGPSFLRQPENEWPESKWHMVLSEECKPQRFVFVSIFDYSPLERFSSFDRMIRSVAYARRFIENLRRSRAKQPILTSSLSVEEYDSSLLTVVRIVQSESFGAEIEHIRRHQRVATGGSLLSLAPFVDNAGILRVGGRLRNSSLSSDARPPILLPSRHHFTKLLIRREHWRLKHSGVQLTLSALRHSYWPIAARSSVRQIVNDCVVCRRYKSKPAQQMMGDLPLSRVTPSRPFTSSSVDFAGPFSATEFRRRGQQIHKLYLCIFVCHATRAIHIEIVTSLTSEAFLAALRRFVGRRGMVRHMYSDNAGNFVAANKELARFFESKHTRESLAALVNQGITWHFQPPRSPHMGGLHEAAVKSAKQHLKYTIGTQILTFEEFLTLAAEIEGTLNSRPLYPLSSDPNDLAALTPGHFLIGEPLVTLPHDDLTSRPSNRISRWQLIQQMRQHFWNRWSRDYLNSMQQRVKWRISERGILEGDIVIMIEENNPPSTWKLARVLGVTRGRDGLVRVLSLKTASGTFSRAVNRVVLLLPAELPDAGSSRGAAC